jgi:hypothetical protein
MGSGNIANVRSEDIGIIPRALAEIFDRSARLKESRRLSIRISYIEIHNEEVRDLLHPTAKSVLVCNKLMTWKVRLLSYESVRMGQSSWPGRERRRQRKWMQRSGFQLPHPLTAHYFRLLETGSVSRTVGSTLMNQFCSKSCLLSLRRSSRSHAIFTLTVDQRPLTCPPHAALPYTFAAAKRKEIITAKFHLVDLAGSERAKRTGNEGSQLVESTNINKGLFVLGQVIRCSAPPLPPFLSYTLIILFFKYSDMLLQSFLFGGGHG